MFADSTSAYWDSHSGELLILILFALVVGTLMVIVPQLLRTHMRKCEMEHTEHMKALEQGIPLGRPDDASHIAGRTALLVPMVVVISASTVTCFLVAYRSDQIFAVSLAAWSVSGIVSLAAITGGVALIGRLAQLRSGEEDELPPPNPME
jgi:hypothetical protein